jgi:NAD(P)-dependent dehydrogenase (short-subunit alcohol dehydrogenase family)
MELGLKNKVVLVTGGSKGIGYACAEAFCREGAKVAIASRLQANLDGARERLEAQGYKVLAVCSNLIISDEAKSLVAAVERALGPIDVLINSVGAAKRYAPEELVAQSWHDAMDAKFFAMVHPLDAILPAMLARGRGVIVNIIGMGGKVASPIHLPGGAANAALMLVNNGLAAAYGKQGIRVNAISPGATMTGRVKESLAIEAKRAGITEDEALAKGQARIPLGRYGEPGEIAELALFLASDRASYITGAIVPMDGGSNPVI